MYLCICKGVTEDMLKKALSRGYKGKALLKVLGVGDDCGSCLLDAANLLNSCGDPCHSEEKREI